MKKLLGVFCAVLCLNVAFATHYDSAGRLMPKQAAEPGIEFFHGSWEDALLVAEAEKKLIFLDAYAVWCGPCKMMAATAFKDKAVGEFFNKNFINYKMDMEKDVHGSRLTTKFELVAYPTLYFINGKEKLIHTQMGAQNAAQLLALGKTALEKK
jgi:thiol:disulfide interchange protein